MAKDIDQQFIVVLHRPRDVRNIGGVVRAMLNTGLRQLRLVAPPSFTAEDILGIAHRSESILAGIERFDTLDAALIDITYVLGTSARPHGEYSLRGDVRTLAAELRAHAGSVALLFGPEDNGLDAEALDRCHTLLRLPVDPAYPSLNLAQAVLLVGYELWMASAPPVEAPASKPLAAAEQLETLFNETEQALATIEFFKNGSAPTMRSLRQLAYRAAINRREAALLLAIAREVQRFLERQRA